MMKLEHIKLGRLAVFAVVAGVTTAIVIPGSGIYTFWHEIGHALFGGYNGGFRINWETGTGSTGVVWDGPLVSAAGTFFPPIVGVLILWIAPFWLKGYSLCLEVGAFCALSQYGSDFYLSDFHYPGAFGIALVLSVLAASAYVVLGVLMMIGRAPKPPKIPRITGFSVDVKQNRLNIHRESK